MQALSPNISSNQFLPLSGCNIDLCSRMHLLSKNLLKLLCLCSVSTYIGKLSGFPRFISHIDPKLLKRDIRR